jgi:hypothetical protein
VGGDGQEPLLPRFEGPHVRKFVEDPQYAAPVIVEHLPEAARSQVHDSVAL